MALLWGVLRAGDSLRCLTMGDSSPLGMDRSLLSLESIMRGCISSLSPAPEDGIVLVVVMRLGEDRWRLTGEELFIEGGLVGEKKRRQVHAGCSYVDVVGCAVPAMMMVIGDSDSDSIFIFHCHGALARSPMRWRNRS